MSYQEERRFVLDMLEMGKINPGQATTLLDVLSQPHMSSLGRERVERSDSKIYLEIDADRENIQRVLGQLNEAVRRI